MKKNCIPILRGLLSYHKRAVLSQKPCLLAQGDNGCYAAKQTSGASCSTLPDVYADALEEAIRCAEIVYGMGLE